jgi:death-on-curing protein
MTWSRRQAARPAYATKACSTLPSLVQSTRRAYEGVEDLHELAATYAIAISANHPFVDGNKRMAFMALGQFLIDNGVDLTAGDADATEIMLKVARNQLSITDLATWLRGHTARRRP